MCTLFHHVSLAQIFQLVLVLQLIARNLIRNHQTRNSTAAFGLQNLRRLDLEELPCATDTETWALLGPFDSTHDFFGDDSLYCLNARGHMPGNLAALALVRTKAGQSKYVILGGDCGHCNLFTYWPDAPFEWLGNYSLMGHCMKTRRLQEMLLKRLQNVRGMKHLICLFGMRKGSFRGFLGVVNLL